MPRCLLWPVAAIALFVIGEGCGSISIAPGADGGGHGGTTGTGGGHGGAAGGSGGAGGVPCGSIVCGAGMVCCNAACGICTPPNGGCVQGCMVDAGAGGAGGSGGHGGGHADAGKETCDQLVSDYANALLAARACTPGGANQCQTLVENVLSSCSGCEQYVNDATPLNAIRMQWMNQGCLQTGILCPAIACVLPGPTKCTASDGGSGLCTVSPPISTN